MPRRRAGTIRRAAAPRAGNARAAIAEPAPRGGQHRNGARRRCGSRRRQAVAVVALAAFHAGGGACRLAGAHAADQRRRSAPTDRIAAGRAVRRGPRGTAHHAGGSGRSRRRTSRGIRRGALDQPHAPSHPESVSRGAPPSGPDRPAASRIARRHPDARATGRGHRRSVLGAGGLAQLDDVLAILARKALLVR